MTNVITTTPSIELISKVLELPSNTTSSGHSPAHGLGKLKDLFERKLISGDQHDDGSIVVATPVKNYRLPNSGGLLVKMLIDVLGNSRDIDTELSWLEKGVVTASQFKMLGGTTPAKKAAGGVVYAPLTNVNAAEWLQFQTVEAVKDCDLLTVLEPIWEKEVLKSKTKEQLLAIIADLFETLVPTTTFATFREMEKRQKKELEKFDFLSVPTRLPVQTISINGVVQQGIYIIDIKMEDVKTFAADCKKVEGLTFTNLETVTGQPDPDTGIADNIAAKFKLDFSKVKNTSPATA